MMVPFLGLVTGILNPKKGKRYHRAAKACGVLHGANTTGRVGGVQRIYPFKWIIFDGAAGVG